MGISLVSSMLLAAAQPAAAQGYRLFVPMVATQGTGPASSGEAPEACNLNEQEAVVAQLMENDPGQQRTDPVCDPILSQVARARARDMALRSYFSHTNPDGIGPNSLVRAAGYALPDWYSDAQSANNIESIGGGYENASALWEGWLKSPKHRTHVLGTDAFYAGQQAYGVGYFYLPDSPLKHYWVFISAPLEE